MRTREDIEAYLIRSGLPYEEVGEDMWIVHDTSSTENIVVRLAGPLVVFRLKVLETSQVKDADKLYQKLLELNAGEMVHGAYGIADGAIVVTCSLRMENLDYNEFQGTIDDFTMALTNHYETLAAFRADAA
jgi:hypothetical protein